MTADYAVLEELATTFKASSAEFEAIGPLVTSGQNTVLSGCGQFAGRVDTGMSQFATSWEAAAKVCADSVQLCSHNTHGFVVDLTRTDAQMAGEIVL